METKIGPTLREARTRRRIDLVEVEKRTKIRVRYLRALENEEWDVLPGPTYIRSFIRTYASFLGLDGDRLADDYRRAHEEPVAEVHPRVEPAPLAGGPGGGRGGWPQIGPGPLAVLISVALVGLLVLIGVLSGGSDDGGEKDTSAVANQRQRSEAKQRQAARKRAQQPISVDLVAEADVWVCLVNSKGNPLVNGQILTSGQEEGPFRSGRFTVRFGNGSITMEVNGSPAPVEETSSPVGYAIDPGGEVRSIPDSEQPTCT